MKWIETYSGQLINLDHMSLIEASSETTDGIESVWARSPGVNLLIAGLEDGERDLDEVMVRIRNFILGKSPGYNKSLYSFPESDKARADVKNRVRVNYEGSDGGQISPSKLPKLSLRHVPDDLETPYHVYAGDELVERLAVEDVA